MALSCKPLVFVFHYVYIANSTNLTWFQIAYTSRAFSSSDGRLYPQLKGEKLRGVGGMWRRTNLTLDQSAEEHAAVANAAVFIWRESPSL